MLNRDKPIIVWDVDDVLNHLTEDWLAWYKKEHQACTVKLRDLYENPPHQILSISKDEYLTSLDEFRVNFFCNLTPSREILNLFEKYGDRFRHYALSAVPYNFANISSEWTFKHFGKWIRGFHFVPSFRKNAQIPHYHKSKLDVIVEIKDVFLFIDDNEGNVNNVMDYGINSVLYPAPWNRNKKKSGSKLIAENLNIVENI